MNYFLNLKNNYKSVKFHENFNFFKNISNSPDKSTKKHINCVNIIKHSLTFIPDIFFDFGKKIIFKYSNFENSENYFFNSIKINCDFLKNLYHILYYLSNKTLQRGNIYDKIMTKKYLNTNDQLKYILFADKSGDDTDIEFSEAPNKSKKIKKRPPPNPINFKVTRNSIYGANVQSFIGSSDLKAKSNSMANMKQLSSFKPFTDRKNMIDKLAHCHHEHESYDVSIAQNHADHSQSIYQSSESIHSIENNTRSLIIKSTFKSHDNQQSFQSFKPPNSPLTARNNLFADIRNLKSQLDSKPQNIPKHVSLKSCYKSDTLTHQQNHLITNITENSPSKLSLVDVAALPSEFRHSLHLNMPKQSGKSQHSHSMTDSDVLESSQRKCTKKPVNGSNKQKLSEENSFSMSTMKKSIKEETSKTSKASCYYKSLDRSDMSSYEASHRVKSSKPKSTEFLNIKNERSSEKLISNYSSNQVRKCQSSSDLLSNTNIESIQDGYDHKNLEKSQSCRNMQSLNLFQNSKSKKCQLDYINKTTYTGTGRKIYRPNKIQNALSNLYTSSSGFQKVCKSMENILSSPPSFTLPRNNKKNNQNISSGYPSNNQEIVSNRNYIFNLGSENYSSSTMTNYQYGKQSSNISNNFKSLRNRPQTSSKSSTHVLRKLKSVKESSMFDRNNFNDKGLSRHQTKLMFEEDRAEIHARDALNTTYIPPWKECRHKEPK